MQAIYKQAGGSIDFVPDSDVAAGSVVVLEDLIGVTKLDIKSGELGALALEGVFDVRKVVTDIENSITGEVIANGEKLYWSGSAVTLEENNGLTGEDLVEYKYFGKAVGSAVEIDDRVRVKLLQG